MKKKIKKRIKKEKNFWDNLSPKYDTFIQKYWKIYETSLLNKIADDVETDSTILDIACGTGLVSFEAAKKAKKVYGVDIAPSMIEDAKKKTREMEIKNVEFSVEDAYKLPFDKFKMALTISILIGQLPVFHKLDLDEFADFIN
jgi:ubiquinone/menaquinone biosynthesis C-methylase UbiE